MLAGNITFFNNSVTFGNTSGPAIYLIYGAILNITKDATVVFSSNKAATVSLQGDGGAIYVIHFSVVYISGYVKFVNNQANGRGGAIALEKNVMINIIGNANVSFINNTSSSGGAISTYFGNMSIVNSSVTFINNVATQWGGAVHFFNSDLFVRMLVDLRFISNTAATQGGAIMMADGTFTIDDYSQLFLFKNHAVQGGGVFMYSSYMEFSLNVTARFVNNTATDVGGAVYALAQPSFPCFYYITVWDTQLSTVEIQQVVKLEITFMEGA